MRTGPLFVFIGLISLVLIDLSCTQAPRTTTDIAKVDTPMVFQDKESLFRAGQFYFGGQPDEEMLRWMADDQVKLVINLRTDEEMETHSEENFDEAALIDELGMKYLHFPLGGKAGYSTQAVDTLAYVLKMHDGKTFIHCKSGGRVSYLWVAYLVKYKGLAIDDAVDIGKKMKFSFVLEDLLGYAITMQRKE